MQSAESRYLITYDMTFCLAWRTLIMRVSPSASLTLRTVKSEE